MYYDVKCPAPKPYGVLDFHWLPEAPGSFLGTPGDPESSWRLLGSGGSWEGASGCFWEFLETLETLEAPGGLAGWGQAGGRLEAGWRLAGGRMKVLNNFKQF